MSVERWNQSVIMPSVVRLGVAGSKKTWQGRVGAAGGRVPGVGQKWAE
jgi:hypothetical protein